MAKRISSSAVNWSFIMETLPQGDKIRIMPLKMASDKYLRDIASKSAELPKIDWDLYKKKISVPGLVDSFQKSYESLKIPYPSDQGILVETEKYNAELMEFANQVNNEVLKKIEELKEKLKKLESLMKFSSMTMEELYLAKPECRFNPDNPKFYPQFEEGDPVNPDEKTKDH